MKTQSSRPNAVVVPVLRTEMCELMPCTTAAGLLPTTSRPHVDAIGAKHALLNYRIIAGRPRAHQGAVDQALSVLWSKWHDRIDERRAGVGAHLDNHLDACDAARSRGGQRWAEVTIVVAAKVTRRAARCHLHLHQPPIAACANASRHIRPIVASVARRRKTNAHNGTCDSYQPQKHKRGRNADHCPWKVLLEFVFFFFFFFFFFFCLVFFFFFFCAWSPLCNYLNAVWCGDFYNFWGAIRFLFLHSVSVPFFPFFKLRIFIQEKLLFKFKHCLINGIFESQIMIRCVVHRKR